MIVAVASIDSSSDRRHSSLPDSLAMDSPSSNFAVRGSASFGHCLRRAAPTPAVASVAATGPPMPDCRPTVSPSIPVYVDTTVDRLVAYTNHYIYKNRTNIILIVENLVLRYFSVFLISKLNKLI